MARTNDKLNAERSAHEQTRKQLSELTSQTARTDAHVKRLEADLNEARSALEQTAPAQDEERREIEELHAEIDTLELRLSSSEAAKESAEETRARLEEQLQQAHVDARTARNEASVRLGDLQARLREKEAEARRLEAQLAWVEVADDGDPDVGSADAAEETMTTAEGSWGDDPNQDRLASMILDAARYKRSGGEEGQPLNVRDVLALSDTSCWSNREAAGRFRHAVSKIRPQVDDATYRAVEAEVEQFYFTFTS